MQGPHSKGFARHPLLDLGQLASNPAFESEAAALSNRHTDLTPRRPTPPPTAHPNRHTPTKIAYRPIPHTQSMGKPNRKPRDWSPGAQTDPKLPIKGLQKAGGLSPLVPISAQPQTKTASSAAAQTASGCHEPTANSATQAVHGLPGLALEAQLQSAVHSKEAADFDVLSQRNAQDPMVPAMTTPHSDALNAGANVTGTASATATAQAVSGLGQSPAALLWLALTALTVLLCSGLTLATNLLRLILSGALAPAIATALLWSTPTGATALLLSMPTRATALLWSTPTGATALLWPLLTRAAVLA